MLRRVMQYTVFFFGGIYPNFLKKVRVFQSSRESNNLEKKSRVFEKHCVLKILGLKKIGPPQAENFEDLGGCFMQKMPPDCTQERVFCERTPSKKSKISACGGPKTSFLNVSDHLKSQNFRFRNSKKNL